MWGVCKVVIDQYSKTFSSFSIMYTSSGENTLPFSSVPAFLTKLWTLVEDPSTDELICWDAVSRTLITVRDARV